MMTGGFFSPGYADRLEAKIIDDIGQKQIDVGNDICQDFPAYRYACGVIAGLRRALEIQEEFRKEIE